MLIGAAMLLWHRQENKEHDIYMVYVDGKPKGNRITFEREGND